MKNKDFVAIAERLLPDLKGFVQRTPMVILLPINHFLRAIYFESSGIDRRSFYVWVFFQPLFVPTQNVNFNLGFRLRDTEGNERWHADAPNLIATLGQALQAQALPFLEAIGSPRAAAEMALSLGVTNPHVQEAVAYSLVLGGEINKAIGAIDRLIVGLDLEMPWQREIADRSQTLKYKLVSNPANALRQLQEWEILTIRSLGLEELPSGG